MKKPDKRMVPVLPEDAPGFSDPVMREADFRDFCRIPAVSAEVNALTENRVERIILMRPVVEAFEQKGHEE